jgi:hypothetical protein
MSQLYLAARKKNTLSSKTYHYQSTPKNEGCDAYRSEGLLLSLLSAVCSQGETNLPLVSIHILARASQPT